jgi:hypothetical protein
MLITSGIIYVLLPGDWMSEFRFATPFIVNFSIYLFVLGQILINKLNSKNLIIKIVSVILAIVIFIPSTINYLTRSYEFRTNPTYPFESVAEAFGNKYDEFAKILNVENASLLIPDMGGTLFYSKLKIYDLTGLTDKTIARTLEGNKKAFYNYIFEALKPTFIHTDQDCANQFNLDHDKRFRENYISIIEERVNLSMMNNESTEIIYCGDYVRKDVLNDNFEILLQLRNEDSIYEIE